MKTLRLSQVCKIVNGGTPKSGVADYWHGDVAWLTPAEMGKRTTPYISRTARTISVAGLANSSARQVPVGSVIMSTRAPIGHLSIPEIPMAFNQGCRGLIPAEGLDTEYLYYFLWFSREPLNELGTGTTFKELSSSALGNYEIPLPPIEEQQRIVAFLHEAFAAIATATANAERNLANARGVLMSAIDEAFSKGVSDMASTELGALIEVTHGYAFDGSQFEPSDDPSKPIVLTPGNYTEDAELSFTPKNTKRLVSGAERSGFRFAIGDLTVVMTDLSSKMKILGRPAFIEEGNILHNQRIGRVVPKDDRANLRMIYYFMQTSRSLNRIRDTATGTMVRHTAPKRILSNVMNYPRLLDDQRALVARLDAISLETRALERIQLAKIAKFRQLKQSFLQSAFSGRIETRLATSAA